MFNAQSTTILLSNHLLCRFVVGYSIHFDVLNMTHLYKVSKFVNELLLTLQ